MNLREQVVADMAISIEGEWGLPAILVSPDQITYSVRGQVLYNSRVVDPDTGEQVIAQVPVLVLREASLLRVPQPGEKWGVKIPLTPSETAPKVDFVLSDRPPERSSLGFVRLYLTRIYE